MYICRRKLFGFVSKKVESGLHFGDCFAGVDVNRSLWGIVFTVELQRATDGDRSAVDMRAVVDSEDFGRGVVGKGVLCAVNADRTGVCRAVVLP